jgi:hypothetical protein
VENGPPRKGMDRVRERALNASADFKFERVRKLEWGSLGSSLGFVTEVGLRWKL